MTKIRKEAKQFVRLFNVQVEKAPINKKKLLKLFKKTVENLKHRDLRDEITVHQKFYIKFLKSLSKGKTEADEGKSKTLSKEERLDEDGLHYNLYWKPKCTSINKAISPDSDSKIIYNCLLHQQIASLSQEKILQLLGNFKGDGESTSEWSKLMKSLSTLSIGRLGKAEDLHEVMSIFHSAVVENTSDILSCSRKRMIELQKSFYQFLLFFHTVSQRINATNVTLKPSYEEYMSSFLSLYIDMEIYSCQEESEENLQIKGKQIVSRVTLLLDRWPIYVLEVILQLTNHLMQSARNLLQPLLRKALLYRPKKDCHKEYTKYVCCVRHVKACMLSELQMKVEEFIMGLPAPKHYLKWLREQNASILDEIPETKHFKGVRITHFLLKEATDELLEGLLQLLSAEDVEQSDENAIGIEPTRSAESNEMETEPANEQLYFFDTTANGDVRDTVESTLPSTSENADMVDSSLESEEEMEVGSDIEEEMEDSSSDNDDHHPVDILANTASALDEVLHSKEEEVEEEKEHCKPEEASRNKVEEESESESESGIKSEGEIDEKQDDAEKKDIGPIDVSMSSDEDDAKSYGGMTDVELLSQTPQKLSKTPQKLSQIPQKLSQTPQKLSQTPQKLSPTPQKLSQTPQKLSQTPQKLSQTPQKLSNTSQNDRETINGKSAMKFIGVNDMNESVNVQESFAFERQSPHDALSPMKPGSTTKPTSAKKSSPMKLASPKKLTASESKQDAKQDQPNLISPIGKRLRPRKSFIISSPAQPSAAASPARRTQSLLSETSNASQKSPVKSVAAQPEPLGSQKSEMAGNEALSSSPVKMTPSPVKEFSLSLRRRSLSPSIKISLQSDSTVKSPNSAETDSPSKLRRRLSSESAASSTKGMTRSVIDTSSSVKLPTPSKKPETPSKKSATPSKKLASPKSGTPSKRVATPVVQGKSEQKLPVRLTREHLKKRLAVVLGDVMEDEVSNDELHAREVKANLNLTPARSKLKSNSKNNSPMKKGDGDAVAESETPNKKYQNDIISLIGLSSPRSSSAQIKTKIDRRRSMPAKITPLSPSTLKDTPKKAVVKLSRIEELKTDEPGSSSESVEGSPGPRRSGRIRRLSSQSLSEQPITPKKLKNLPSTPSRGTPK